MPLKPGPGNLWKDQPSGQWSPVAFGPLSGPLHLRRSKLPRWPLPSDTQTTPLLSMSAPRAPKPGFGTVYTSASAVSGGFDPGTSLTTAPGTASVEPQIDPSTGLGITA